jgi:hypothetical protein
VAHTCNLSYSGGRGSGGLQFKASPSKSFERPYLENIQPKETGLEEWLKVWALSSNTSTAKKKKKALVCCMSSFPRVRGDSGSDLLDPKLQRSPFLTLEHQHLQGLGLLAHGKGLAKSWRSGTSPS